MGKTGVGKSSTGNALLGRQLFETSRSLTSVTKEAQYGEATRFGRRLLVVDTPGFYDTERSNQDIVREIIRIFGFLNPGIHVLIYVMGIERFTKECIKTKNLMLRTFGEEIKTRTIIVITHFDDLQSDHVDTKQFLASSGTDFVQFQNICNNRVFFINNKACRDDLEHQVSELIRIIDDVTKQHDGKCFTNEHLKIVRAYFKLERIRKVKKLSRARKLLFKRAATNLGLQNAVVWDEKNNKPVSLSVPKGASSFMLQPLPKIKPASTRGKTEKIKVKIVSVKQSTDVIDKKHRDLDEDIKLKQTTRDETRSCEIKQEAKDEEVKTDPDDLYTQQVVDNILNNDDDDNEHERGSEECTGDHSGENKDELTVDRQKVKDKSFFEKLADFFSSLFDQIVE